MKSLRQQGASALVAATTMSKRKAKKAEKQLRKMKKVRSRLSKGTANEVIQPPRAIGEEPATCGDRLQQQPQGKIRLHSKPKTVHKIGKKMARHTKAAIRKGDELFKMDIEDAQKIIRASSNCPEHLRSLNSLHNLALAWATPDTRQFPRALESAKAVLARIQELEKTKADQRARKAMEYQQMREREEKEKKLKADEAALPAIFQDMALYPTPNSLLPSFGSLGLH